MKIYKFFNPVPDTLEELKKQYRELAHKHHPDNGDDAEVMKIINNEYSALFPRLKDTHQTKDGTTYTTKEPNTETAEQFIDLINVLMQMDGIIIEVIGCFVWVSGETKPYKEALKELNFRWHTKKFCWYLAPEDYRKRSRKDYSLDEIRNMYGTSGEVNSRGSMKLDERASA